jgi:hypothetical protein
MKSDRPHQDNYIFDITLLPSQFDVYHKAFGDAPDTWNNRMNDTINNANSKAKNLEKRSIKDVLPTLVME